VATISFSPSWTLRGVPWIFRWNTSGGSAGSDSGLLCSGGGYNSGTPWPNARIDIMKGTVPTTLVGLETLTARSTDLLMRFSCPSSNPAGSMTQYFMAPGLGAPGSGEGTNPQIINTIYQTASGAGTATWFRWLVVSMPLWNADPTGVVHQIVGTISTNGGGGDLQMDSTTIAAGQQYRISGIQFYMPTSFTY
jgi:hypothetical protein